MQNLQFLSTAPAVKLVRITPSEIMKMAASRSFVSTISDVAAESSREQLCDAQGNQKAVQCRVM